MSRQNDLRSVIRESQLGTDVPSSLLGARFGWHLFRYPHPCWEPGSAGTSFGPLPARDTEFNRNFDSIREEPEFQALREEIGADLAAQVAAFEGKTLP